MVNMGFSLEQLLQEFNLETVTNTFSYGIENIADVAVYIFVALAIYTIAQRRNFDRPWMAWVPVAQDYIVGSLSDQYQLTVQRKVTCRRKYLLGANLATVVSAIVLVIMLLVTVWNLLAAGYNNYDGEYDSVKVWGSTGGVILAVVVFVAAVITRTVYFHMSLYDIYRSCDPKNATLFTVLGIFFGFLPAVFLMICKDKDEGMYIPRVPREPWETEM